MGNMTATHELIGDTRTRDVGVRQFGASLAFQARHLGAGLGWHGWHGSIAAYHSMTTDAHSHLLEACS